MNIDSILQDEIRSFNGIAEKHNYRIRLKYLPDQEMHPGRLVMGSLPQLQNGMYQAILSYGQPESISVAKSLRMYICAEFGE